MVGGSNIDDPQRLLRDAVQGLRFLGNNDNNNNNNNNNQNNNYYYGGNMFSYGSLDLMLLVGTIAFCVAVALIVFFRIKCYKRSERKRKRLGISRASVRQRNKHSVSNSFEDEDDGFVTDKEIQRYILPSKQQKAYEDAANVMKCDKETNRIMKLCKPFWMQAIVSGVCDVLNTALLGRALGVNALAIYFIVTVPTTFTDTIISAVLETISSLGGQSIGVGSYKLTGQYCQISLILYTVMFIPHALLWIFCLKPTLRWFAPDLGDEIIEEGYNYFLVGLIGTYLGAFSDVLHSLLEVTDHYNYSMYSDVVGNIVGVLAFFAYVNINPGNEKSIVWVEVIDTVIILVFLFVDLYVTKRMKWFDDFWKGILRSVAMKNWEAVWLVLKTAGPMSVGNILLTVEWELLAIFAAHLGAAPVAAWGIVGTIWGILEYVTECVSEAGEIRVAKLLGNGNPRLAKLSAYKCLFVGNTIATLVTVVFLIGMPWVPGLFTDNQNLQGLIADVLPYCAIGNFALTVGSLSWTLIGAQGRYAVATFHGCIGSIGVTIPAACFTTFYLGWGLPALAATVVIGYMTSSAFNVITLFLSDWEYIAYRVMMRNGATEPVAEDDYFGDVGQWNVFNFMSKNLEIPFMDENDSHRSKGSKTGSNTEDESQSHRSTNKDNVLIDTLEENASSFDTDDSKSKGSNSEGPISSWWSAFGYDHKEEEVRTVVIGPGKLGYTIQSTENGPMIVGLPEDESFMGFTSPFKTRAKFITGELFLGDLIVQVDKTQTDLMSGKQLAKFLRKREQRHLRTLTVSHREGTGFSTVYQPGPYGSAAIEAVLKNSKEMGAEEFEDDGVVGAGYMSMGWFS